MSAATMVGALCGLALLLGRWPSSAARHLAARRAWEGDPGDSFRWRRRSRPSGRATEGEVLALAESLAAALSSGLDTDAAHRVVTAAAGGDDSSGLEALQLRPGETAAMAWARAGEHSAAARRVGRALGVSSRTGSPAAAAVRVAVAAGRQHLEHEGAIAGAVSGARATARMLSLLPFAGPLAVAGLGLDPGAAYLSPAAAGATVAGLVLTVVGHRWVTRLSARAAREDLVV